MPPSDRKRQIESNSTFSIRDVSRSLGRGHIDGSPAVVFSIQLLPSAATVAHPWAHISKGTVVGFGWLWVVDG